MGEERDGGGGGQGGCGWMAVEVGGWSALLLKFNTTQHQRSSRHFTPR